MQLPNSPTKLLNPLGESEQWSKEETSYPPVEIPPHGTHSQKTEGSPPLAPADRMVCCKLVIMYQLLALSVKLRGKDVIWLFMSILND